MAVGPLAGTVSWETPSFHENDTDEITPTADPTPSTPNPSLIGRVQYDRLSSSGSSFDWTTRSSSPSESDTSARTPATVLITPRSSIDDAKSSTPAASLVSSCNIAGIASSTHSAPPVPKLDLDSRRRRTSSAPAAITPKISPSHSASTALPMASASPLNDLSNFVPPERI